MTGQNQPAWRLFLKRALDIELALIGLVVLAPVLLAIAIAVRRKLGKPVLFVQPRPGLGGRPFMLYKFRSMTDARDETGALRPNAERLVPLGRFLRQRSLDELPELINVLKGDMSLVGPRPLLTEFLSYYTEEECKRHTVRPGITGLAQVSGRDSLSWEEKMAHDLTYVRNLTLWLDVILLLRTVLRVLRRSDPEEVLANGGITFPPGFDPLTASPSFGTPLPPQEVPVQQRELS